jgi:hypothetical protein
MRTVAALVYCVGLILIAGCGQSNTTPIPPVAVTIQPDDGPVPIPGGEHIESPVYKLWARFPVGSRVTQRTTTENESNTEKTVTTIAYTLKQKTDEYVVVESQATTNHYDGRVEKNPPSETKTRKLFTLPPGAKKPDGFKGQREEGEEALQVAGKDYKTKWFKSKDFTEAGELLSQTWTSEEMPGGLVKSVSKVAAKKATITVEVTAVTIP